MCMKETLNISMDVNLKKLLAELTGMIFYLFQVMNQICLCRSMYNFYNQINFYWMNLPHIGNLPKKK